VGVVAVIVLLAACAHSKTTAPTAEPYRAPLSGARVLLMPLDVELYEMTTVGMIEPNAEWTQTAQRNLTRVLTSALASRGAEPVFYHPADDPLRPIAAEHLQLLKLHEAVGSSILSYRYIGFDLPTTEDRFDWTLGPGVKVLKDAYESDLALFLFARESFASMGRKAFIVTYALLFGGILPGGQQVFFASLVDLKNGKIVWFNVTSRGYGDLRDIESAESAVKALLEDAPL
jgi:hypothetical protein